MPSSIRFGIRHLSYRSAARTLARSCFLPNNVTQLGLRGRWNARQCLLSAQGWSLALLPEPTPQSTECEAHVLLQLRLTLPIIYIADTQVLLEAALQVGQRSQVAAHAYFSIDEPNPPNDAPYMARGRAAGGTARPD